MISNQTEDKTPESGSIRRPDKVGAVPPTSQAELDAALADLQADKDRWASLPIHERFAVLDTVLQDLHSVGEEWVALNVEAKGTRGNPFAEGEEWAVFAIGLRNVRLLGQSLRDIQKHGRPRLPGPITTRTDGQVVAQVYPQSLIDRLMLPGTKAEVWMQPGHTAAERARFYRGNALGGKVVLVLGAGNTSALIPTDFLYKLFVEGHVVLLKLNPVNAYLGPTLEKGFQALIGGGYLRIVYGGAQEGSYLCHHAAVDEIHMTGSYKTYEAIVFGSGEGGTRRKLKRQPSIDKRFTAELGNVTPVFVLPGPWSDDDITAQADKLAMWLTINAGFNCMTPRVIIQWAGWDQRVALNEAIARSLSQEQTRKAYYPGAQETMAQFHAAHPQANQFGSAGDGHLPWTYITGVDAQNPTDICFRSEAFCGLFAETGIEAPSVETFLDRAVDFANETLWGNLMAAFIVHPDSLKDPQVAAALDRAISRLRYGTVAINQFGGLAFTVMTISWGAFPGNDMYDIQSGVGVTTNVLMFDFPQKSVVRSPFRLSPDPFSLKSRTIVEFGKKYADLQYKPSLRKIPAFSWSALRS